MYFSIATTPFGNGTTAGETTVNKILPCRFLRRQELLYTVKNKNATPFSVSGVDKYGICEYNISTEGKTSNGYAKDRIILK